jgi:hypothetical protein
MTTEIKFIDRDEAIAAIAAIDRANEAKNEDDEIAELRRIIIALTTEIDQKQRELFAIQVALAGQVDA